MCVIKVICEWCAQYEAYTRVKCSFRKRHCVLEIPIIRFAISTMALSEQNKRIYGKLLLLRDGEENWDAIVFVSALRLGSEDCSIRSGLYWKMKIALIVETSHSSTMPYLPNTTKITHSSRGDNNKQFCETNRTQKSLTISHCYYMLATTIIMWFLPHFLSAIWFAFSICYNNSLLRVALAFD